MKRAGLIYFLAGGAKPPAWALDEAGRVARKEHAEGPAGVGTVGVLASPCRGAFDLAHEPDRQRWVRSGTDGLWIGVDLLDKLCPNDVVRAEIVPGHTVTLGDGQAWEIPVARFAHGGTGLPRRRVLTDGGGRAWEVEEAYRDLCGFAEQAWRARAGDDVAITQDELDRYCGQAMGVNYRLGEEEAIALGLFTDRAQRGILDALLDWPTVLAIAAAQKKTFGTPES